MSTPDSDPTPSDPRAMLRDTPTDTGVTAPLAALRLAVLRLDFPDAIVQVDPVRQDDIAIAVKATIGLPSGARHTAIAAVDVDTMTGWAEQYAQTEAVAIARALDGLGQSLDRQIQAQGKAGAAQPSVPQRSDEDDHLPEYSWNAFWREAHARNLSRDQVEQALGRSIQEVTPRDAVLALQAAGRW